jgi:hypothetical protein
MEGSIIFYTYGSTLELNGQQFEAGRLTEDLLNLSPDDYHPLHERMVRIRTLMDIYEYVRKSELWWKLNDEMEQLCQELRRYTVFRLLPDDCYDAFFSVIREITGQFSLFPPEEHSLSEDDQTKLLSASAEEFFQSDDGDSDPEISLGLLDLFRRREGSEEKGELFYYEMFRLLGACEDTWSAYKKYIDRYMMYLHDIRAFVPTIRNFIKFILSTLTTNGPESYAAALYGFYNDDRIAEKLIVNPIRNNGDCYTTHDAYELSYVPRPLVLADAGYDLRLLRRTGAGAGWQDLPGDRSHQQLPQQGAEQRYLESTSAGLQKIFCPYTKGDDEQRRV